MRRIVAVPLVITGVASLDLQAALQGPQAAALPLTREAVAGASGGDGDGDGARQDDLPKAHVGTRRPCAPPGGRRG